MFTRKKLQTGIIFSLILAFVVMTGISLYADVPRMITALAHFRWQFLPLILGFTLFNYYWRFVKWQYYLKRLQIPLHWKVSALIFLSGLSMAITPGKAGEVLKSYLLKRTTGIPISRTVPIIFSERLSDGIAMLCLATTGLVLYRFGWELLLVLLLIGLTGIILIQNRSLALRVLSMSERVPLLSRAVPTVCTLYESAYMLLQWRPLLLAVGIGIVSWTGECVALYFVYHGLGVAAGLDLFIKAMFILAFSSLIGSASGLPGGLGTADGSMLGLTRLLISSSTTLGGAATLLIRLCTLWFGLAIGVVALLTFRTIRHIDMIRGEGGDVEEEQEEKRNTPKFSINERSSGYKPASSSVHTGEKVV